MTGAPHSAQFLTDARDDYWHDDWLRLVAQRVDLPRAGRGGALRVVDAGCGQGHWTRILARALPPGSSIVGVEREPEWVAKAAAFPAPVDVTTTYRVGDATALPFPDASQDVVTCQTLLIHLPDPRAALREFARVLVPGGLLLAAEPNNLASCTAQFTPSPDYDVDDLCAAVRLEATCEKGKAALGLGYNSLGEGVVGLLDDAQWSDVRAWINDRARVARPPYDDAARRSFADERAWHAQGGGGWPLDETRRYWDAGGGDPAAFAEVLERARRLTTKRLADVDAGRYASVDGSLFYLIAARRRGAL